MGLPKKAIFFIVLNIALAFPVMFFSFSEWGIPAVGVILMWAVLAVLSESLSIVLPNSLEISVGFAVDLACILVGGPSLAIIVSSLGYLFKVVKSDGKYHHLFNLPFYKTLYNVAQGILTTGLAGFAYVFFGGSLGHFAFIPTLSAILTLVLVNSITMSVLLSCLYAKNFIGIWLTNMKDLLVNVIAVSALGVIIAIAYAEYGTFAVFVFFGPLLIARYSFKLYLNMRHTYIETIQAFNKFLEAKDKYTSGHAARVQKYAEMLAQSMNLSEIRIENIKTAALLHDIGKIGVDDRILKKPGKLTTDEYSQIKNHVVIGAEIIDGIDFLKSISKIIMQHHERFDGKGYPKGLKDDEISIEGEILAIADVYDAMTSDRPYRNGMSKSEAMEELRANSGTQFNPQIVEKFLEILEKEDTDISDLKKKII